MERKSGFLRNDVSAAFRSETDFFPVDPASSSLSISDRLFYPLGIFPQGNHSLGKLHEFPRRRHWLPVKPSQEVEMFEWDGTDRVGAQKRLSRKLLSSYCSLFFGNPPFLSSSVTCALFEKTSPRLFVRMTVARRASSKHLPRC